MNISDGIKEEKANAPLHEQRYNDMKRRSLEASFSKASPTKTTVNPNKKGLFGIGESKGKDLLIKPLVYYNIQDCLKNVMTQTDFVDKAKKNIGIVKASRESKGQRLAVKADIKDVLGEFPEGKKEHSYGLGVEKYTMYTFIKDWCGYLVEFEIKQQPVGFGQTKRNGYTFEKASVIYYGKNGVSLKKEIVLRINFWMWPKVKGKDNEQ